MTALLVIALPGTLSSEGWVFHSALFVAAEQRCFQQLRLQHAIVGGPGAVVEALVHCVLGHIAAIVATVGGNR